MGASKTTQHQRLGDARRREHLFRLSPRVYISTHVYLSLVLSLSLYIYIYREREREIDGVAQQVGQGCVGQRGAAAATLEASDRSAQDKTFIKSKSPAEFVQGVGSVPS